jgi:hypothetical protein
MKNPQTNQTRIELALITSNIGGLLLEPQLARSVFVATTLGSFLFQRFAANVDRPTLSMLTGFAFQDLKFKSPVLVTHTSSDNAHLAVALRACNTIVGPESHSIRRFGFHRYATYPIA